MSIWQLTLRQKLAPLAASYDWIVLDFPPNLGVMAICGLVAAHKLIIPSPLSISIGRPSTCSSIP